MIRLGEQLQGFRKELGQLEQMLHIEEDEKTLKILEKRQAYVYSKIKKLKKYGMRKKRS